MQKDRKYFSLVVLFAACLFLNSDLLAQCAMCKASAETSLKSDPNSIARGLNSGILYLMAVPYLAIMFIFRKQLYQLWKKVTARLSKA